jgi:hypothetical protein
MKSEVTSVLEETVMGKLSFEMCGDVLRTVWDARALEAEALDIAPNRFEDSRSNHAVKRCLLDHGVIVVNFTPCQSSIFYAQFASYEGTEMLANLFS